MTIFFLCLNVLKLVQHLGQISSSRVEIGYHLLNLFSYNLKIITLCMHYVKSSTNKHIPTLLPAFAIKILVCICTLANMHKNIRG